MSEVFMEEIAGKSVMTENGSPIGTVEDVVMDTENGEMKYLLVKLFLPIPNQRIDEKGRAVIGFRTLKFSGDGIIIS